MMTAFLITFGILTIAIAVLAVLPFTFTADFAISAAQKQGTIYLQWAHPWIAQFVYDFGNRQATTTLFGKILFSKAKKVGQADASERANKLATLKADAVEDYPLSNEQQPIENRSERNETAQQERIRKREEPHAESHTTNVKRERRGETWRTIKQTVKLLRERKVIRKISRWCFRTLRWSLRLVRFDHLRLHARAGTDDPAETGKLCGWFNALDKCCFSGRKNVELRLDPDFSGEVLECNGSFGIKTSFLRLSIPAMVSLVTFPWLTAYIVWRRLKKIFGNDEAV